MLRLPVFSLLSTVTIAIMAGGPPATAQSGYQPSYTNDRIAHLYNGQFQATIETAVTAERGGLRITQDLDYPPDGARAGELKLLEAEVPPPPTAPAPADAYQVRVTVTGLRNVPERYDLDLSRYEVLVKAATWSITEGRVRRQQQEGMGTSFATTLSLRDGLGGIAELDLTLGERDLRTGTISAGWVGAATVLRLILTPGPPAPAEPDLDIRWEWTAPLAVGGSAGARLLVRNLGSGNAHPFAVTLGASWMAFERWADNNLSGLPALTGALSPGFDCDVRPVERPSILPGGPAAGPSGRLLLPTDVIDGICRVDGLRAGQSGLVLLDLQLPAASGFLSLTAEIIGGPSESDYSNNAARLEERVAAGDANLEVALMAPSSVAPGQPLAYDLTVRNSGTVGLLNVRVDLFLSRGLALEQASGPFRCEPVEGAPQPDREWRCVMGPLPGAFGSVDAVLAAGEEVLLSLQFRAPPEAGSVTLRAEVPRSLFDESRLTDNESRATIAAP